MNSPINVGYGLCFDHFFGPVLKIDESFVNDISADCKQDSNNILVFSVMIRLGDRTASVCTTILYKSIRVVILITKLSLPVIGIDACRCIVAKYHFAISPYTLGMGKDIPIVT